MENGMPCFLPRFLSLILQMFFLQGHGGSEGSLVFCSHNCFVLYSASMQNKLLDGKVSINHNKF